MARRLGLLLSLVSSSLLATLTLSCGSSSGPGGNTGPYNVVGTWQADFSANIGATASGIGANRRFHQVRNRQP
jgi:hypothetical protein